MSEQRLYEYAIVRVVPRVERDEFINVGVALHCRRERYAEVKIYVDEAKCKMLDPSIDLQLIRKHLDSFQWICIGDKRGGQLAALEQTERFRWLTAKRSTLIQCSVVHPGLCESVAETHEVLFQKLVL